MRLPGRALFSDGESKGYLAQHGSVDCSEEQHGFCNVGSFLLRILKLNYILVLQKHVKGNIRKHTRAGGQYHPLKKSELFNLFLIFLFHSQHDL